LRAGLAALFKHSLERVQIERPFNLQLTTRQLMRQFVPLPIMGLRLRTISQHLRAGDVLLEQLVQSLRVERSLALRPTAVMLTWSFSV